MHSQINTLFDINTVILPHGLQLWESNLKFGRGTLQPLVSWVSGMNQFNSPSVGFYYLSIDIYGLHVTIFEVFSSLPKHFYLPVRPGYDTKYRSRSNSFVERQNVTLRDQQGPHPATQHLLRHRRR